MEFPGQEFIEQLEKTLISATDDFAAGVTEANDELLIALREFTAVLDKAPGGAIKATVANLKKVVAYTNQVNKLLTKGAYGEAAGKAISSLNRITLISNSYFNAAVEGFTAKPIYREVFRQTLETTKETLLASGLKANYEQPVMKVLQQGVTGQASSKQLVQTLTETLSEVGQPTRWAKQQVNDGLYQFSRNYTETVSADLGLSHYLYSGTQIDTTRPWCSEKVGKVFTKAEVLAFAGEGWSGKIPGTNAGNILTRAGGYACRHRFIPITKAAYQQMKG